MRRLRVCRIWLWRRCFAVSSNRKSANSLSRCSAASAAACRAGILAEQTTAIILVLSQRASVATEKASESSRATAAAITYRRVEELSNFTRKNAWQAWQESIKAWSRWWWRRRALCCVAGWWSGKWPKCCIVTITVAEISTASIVRGIRRIIERWRGGPSATGGRRSKIRWLSRPRTASSRRSSLRRISHCCRSVPNARTRVRRGDDARTWGTLWFIVWSSLCLGSGERKGLKPQY